MHVPLRNTHQGIMRNHNEALPLRSKIVAATVAGHTRLTRAGVAASRLVKLHRFLHPPPGYDERR